jgi:hypothetical protein
MESLVHNELTVVTSAIFLKQKVPERIEWPKILSETGICYTDPSKMRFRNAVSVCMLLGKNFRNPVSVCMLLRKNFRDGVAAKIALVVTSVEI